MRKLGEIHLLNKILLLSLIFFVVLEGSYYLSKKIGNKNSNTMVFTKGSSPVSRIPEKIPEKEVPPTEWEDVKPVENFDWNVPNLFELPVGQSWRIVDPDLAKHTIPKTIYVRGFEEIPLPGTLYWSGTFEYDSSSYNPYADFIGNLDEGWKFGLNYKGEEIIGVFGGAGGSSFDGVIKMNGPLIRTVIFMGKHWDSKRDLYLYISDPINVDEHVPFSEKVK